MRKTLLLLFAAGAAWPAESGMSLIPAGEFTMGRTKLTSDDKTNMRPHVLLDDRPERRVYVSAFWIDTHEVTQRQYAEFLATTKRTPPYHWQQHRPPAGQEDLAAYNVSWEDARLYCEWKGRRLPTEAEWERAARGGLEKADYPWGDTFNSKLARHNVESGPGAPGQFAANGFGLFDMAGNMAEWTADWFEREYYASAPARDPHGPGKGTYKVIRGGAWSDPPKRLTVFFRNWVRPEMRQPNIGFRCAKNAPPAGSRIRDRITGFPGRVSLSVKNLESGKTFHIDGGMRVRTASTIKLPILIALAQAIADGKARWDEEITLAAEDKVSGSGILREVTPGRTYILRELAHLMIVVSDNTATNLILDRITTDYVNEVMERYGYQHTRVNRKILGDGRDLKPVASGWSRFGLVGENKQFGIGVSTPDEMVRLLEMLEQGRLVNPDSSRLILEILDRQQFKDGIGRRLPGFRVASKSGALDALRSDVGIVYGASKADRFAIAVTVDGMPAIDYSPENAGNRLISELTPWLLETVR
jgi:beta-lactamase class A